jgi:diketogulonate reductase-like aldo/keto reductase
MPDVFALTLNNGVDMPALGLGVFQTPPDETRAAQIEVHPYFAQRDVQAPNAQHGILTQAWSPIGGITFYRDGKHSGTLQNPDIGDIAERHGKSPAQVMLRWHLEQGRSVIPKSIKPARIAENIDVFDFSLGRDELAAIDALDTGRRGGPEPEAITLETFGRPIPED